MHEPSSRDLKLIGSAGVFATVGRKALERLVAPATILTLARRDVLFREGDPTSSFFIVVEGSLKLLRNTSAGEEAVIQLLTCGDSVAAASAFTGKRYLVAAEAVSPARVIRIPMDHVMRCIREMPEIAMAIIAVTSQHVGALVKQVEELKVHSGFRRVADFLACLTSVESGPCKLTLPYDKVLIAGSLGIKPESLSRAFARLRASGVEVHGSCLNIRDVSILRDLAGINDDIEEAEPTRYPAHCRAM